MEEKDNFFYFISYSQIIGIILVVIGHSLHEYPYHGYHTLCYRMIYSFHMPLFLFVSGFLMMYSTGIGAQPRTTFKRFFGNKVRRLLLPMLVLTAVTFVPRAFLSDMADDEVPFTARTFVMSFIDGNSLVIPFFWYLHASFVLLVGGFGLLLISRKLNCPPAVTVLLLFLLLFAYSLSQLPTSTLFSINKIKESGFFLFLGCLYELYKDKIDAVVPFTKIRFLLLSVGLWILAFALLENTAGYFLCSVVGIIWIVSLSKMIEERRWGILNHLQGAVYLIFLLSWYFNIASQQVLAHYAALPWWVHSSLSVVTGIYIPWLGYKYLEHHRTSRWIKAASFILGQSFYKSRLTRSDGACSKSKAWLSCGGKSAG